MTDEQRRQDTAHSLKQWMRAQIARGHPAAIAQDAICAAASEIQANRKPHTTTAQLIDDAIREAAE